MPEPPDATHYLAHRIALRYLPLEDRIRLLCDCDDGRGVVVWLTRRHLMVLLPRLAAWLDRQSPLQRQAVAAEPVRREISNFEHQSARQQISAYRGQTGVRTVAAEFVLFCFGVSAAEGGKVELRLLAAGDAAQVTLRVTCAYLHKLVAELLAAGNAAGWGVADPWQEPVAAAGSGSRH